MNENLSVDPTTPGEDRTRATITSGLDRLMSVSAGKDAEAPLANPYLLPGTNREYSGSLGAACKPGAKVKVVATGERGQKAEKEIVLPPDACGA